MKAVLQVRHYLLAFLWVSSGSWRESVCQSSGFGKMTPRASGVLGGSWNRDYKRIMGIPFKDYIGVMLEGVPSNRGS